MEKLEQWKKAGKSFYISITGLQPKSIWKYLHFFRHAIPSRAQAIKAEGNLFVGVKTINGIQHTLTVWETRDHMRNYIYNGAHRLAIKSFKKIGTGKTFGFEGSEIPTWQEVHEIWKKDGIT
jgi:hypothetical protein